MGGTRVRTPQTGPHLHLKYHFQLKTKDAGGREPIMQGYQQSTVNKCKFVV